MTRLGWKTGWKSGWNTGWKSGWLIGGLLGGLLAVGIIASMRMRATQRSAPDQIVAAETAQAPASTTPPPGAEATPITRAPNLPTAAALAAHAPARAEAAPADDEARTTTHARDIVRTDPDRALVLLDAADHAHPDGALAEDRAAMRVDALVFARRIGPARDAAESYLARYPRGPQAQRIEMLTGVHPRPAEPD